MTDDGKIKYEVYYYKKTTTLDREEEISLRTSGQTDMDTMRLFRELKKEIGFRVEGEQ